MKHRIFVQVTAPFQERLWLTPSMALCTDETGAEIFETEADAQERAEEAAGGDWSDIGIEGFHIHSK